MAPRQHPSKKWCGRPASFFATPVGRAATCCRLLRRQQGQEDPDGLAEAQAAVRMP
jgi:hypothetical protein